MSVLTRPPSEFRLHHLISVTHGGKPFVPSRIHAQGWSPHRRCTTPPFRIGANKIPIPGEKHNVCAGNILFCPLSSLLKLTDTCCFSMCVQTEKKGKMFGSIIFLHKSDNDTINNCDESRIEMIGPSFLHKNRHAMDEKNDVYLQHNDKRKAQLLLQ